MTLTDKIKILLGRKLDPKTLERAKRGEIDRSNEREIEYKLAGDNPVIVDLRYEYCTTPDYSYGWSRPHTGNYLSKRIKNVYNPDGELVFRETLKIDLPYTIQRGFKVVKFEPAGSVLPKKASETELTDYLETAKNTEKKAEEASK